MKRKWMIGLLIGASAALAGAGTIADGDDDEGGGRDRRERLQTRTTVAPVTNQRYIAECAACHMAYQPGLLPARSWVRLMATLDDHFGENAELPQKDRDELINYLVRNAADSAPYRHSKRIMGSLRADNDMPLRITKTPYIARKHREVPARLIAGNPRVKSLSNCAACHTQAKKGIYREHGVSIPGYRAWDD